MISVWTILLKREDLIEIEKNFYSIEISDFKEHIKSFSDVEIILFVDDDGKTKILKNRYGIEGVIGYRQSVFDLLK